MYIELHSRSAFSFLEGASLPEDLVATCANLNMPAMALLDRNGVYGAPRFHMTAKKAGVKAHIGAEVSWEEFPISNCQFPITSGPRLKIGNWKSEIGNFWSWQCLCRIATTLSSWAGSAQPRRSRNCALASAPYVGDERHLLCQSSPARAM